MRANYPKMQELNLAEERLLEKWKQTVRNFSFFKIMTRNKVDRETNGIKKKKKIAPKKVLIVY